LYVIVFDIKKEIVGVGKAGDVLFKRFEERRKGWDSKMMGLQHSHPCM
jgi:hypothetical protein